MRPKLGVYALLALMPLFFASNLIIGRAVGLVLVVAGVVLATDPLRKASGA